MDSEQPISHYKKYKQSIIKSVAKYYEKHKDDEIGQKKAQYHRDYSKRLYQDPEYRERKKAQALERYYRKKAELAGELSV